MEQVSCEAMIWLEVWVVPETENCSALYGPEGVTFMEHRPRIYRKAASESKEKGFDAHKPLLRTRYFDIECGLITASRLSMGCRVLSYFIRWEAS